MALVFCSGPSEHHVHEMRLVPSARKPPIVFAMRIEDFSFGSIQIDAETYEHDVVIDRGEIKKRKKKPSKKFRGKFGHTPLSIVTTRRRAIATGSRRSSSPRGP